MLRHILTSLLCLILGLVSLAQPKDLVLDMQYEQTTLKRILQDLSDRYQLRFVYSEDRLPMDYPISATIRRKPLTPALEELFAEAPVKYTYIGNQIALKADLDALSLNTLPKQVPQQSPIHPVKNRRKAPEIIPPSPMLTSNRPRQIPASNRSLQDEVDLDPLAHSMVINIGDEEDDAELIFEEPRPSPTPQPEEDVEYNRLAQISLIPILSTNEQQLRKDAVNKVSFNLLVGKNGGVNGVEVGGLINGLRNDMIGVQVAGLGNAVGGKVQGTQVAGIFNQTSGRVDGVQVAGLMNVSRDTFTGVQFAGLFNHSGDAYNGIQAAGLFNISKNASRSQIGGLFNVSGDIRGAQVSSMFNVARRVKGFQLGLINIADSSSLSIGLINIVNRGYNRVEFGGSESLHAFAGLKLGTRPFYNIFHIGARWDDTERIVDGSTQVGTFMSWGLGYGIGTTIGLGNRTLLNLEAIGIHVNELEEWTTQLNLMGQFRLLLDLRLGRRFSFFMGPVANIMWSELYNPDTDTYGSIVVPYAQWEEQRGDTNIKAWIGFSAGIRL